MEITKYKRTWPHTLVDFFGFYLFQEPVTEADLRPDMLNSHFLGFCAGMFPKEAERIDCSSFRSGTPP